jgi:hypothetical protein
MAKLHERHKRLRAQEIQLDSHPLERICSGLPLDAHEYSSHSAAKRILADIINQAPSHERADIMEYAAQLISDELSFDERKRIVASFVEASQQELEKMSFYSKACKDIYTPSRHDRYIIGAGLSNLVQALSGADQEICRLAYNLTKNLKLRFVRDARGWGGVNVYSAMRILVSKPLTQELCDLILDACCPSVGKEMDVHAVINRFTKKAYKKDGHQFMNAFVSKYGGDLNPVSMGKLYSKISKKYRKEFLSLCTKLKFRDLKKGRNEVFHFCFEYVKKRGVKQAGDFDSAYKFATTIQPRMADDPAYFVELMKAGGGVLGTNTAETCVLRAEIAQLLIPWIKKIEWKPQIKQIVYSIYRIPPVIRKQVVEFVLNIVKDLSSSQWELVFRSIRPTNQEEFEAFKECHRYLTQQIKNLRIKKEITLELARVSANDFRKFSNFFRIIAEPENCSATAIKNITHTLVRGAICTEPEFIAQAHRLIIGQRGVVAAVMLSALAAVPHDEIVGRIERTLGYLQEHADVAPRELRVILETPMAQALFDPRNNMAQIADAGAVAINVHAEGRDGRTKAGWKLFIKESNRLRFSKRNTPKLFAEFTQYLLRQLDGNRERVFKAQQTLGLGELGIAGPRVPGFGALLSCRVTSYGVTMDPRELIARIVHFADKWRGSRGQNEKENILTSLMNALADSIEGDDGHRVCNPGKLQRILIAVAQARVPGVNVDEVEMDEEPDFSTIVPALMAQFFAEDDNRRRDIVNLEELLREAETFRPLVGEAVAEGLREAFRQELRDFAAF